MTPLTHFTVLLTIMLITAACGGITSSDDPELNGFDLIDTGGSDSRIVAESDLLIDADESTATTNEGEFTLVWEVITDDDYTFDLYINDNDRIGGSLSIYSGICDEGDDCHEDQMLECVFQDDLNLACDDFNSDAIDSVDLGFFTTDYPQDLFFILQVCDPFGFDCEDRSIQVSFDD